MLENSLDLRSFLTDTSHTLMHQANSWVEALVRLNLVLGHLIKLSNTLCQPLNLLSVGRGLMILTQWAHSWTHTSSTFLMLQCRTLIVRVKLLVRRGLHKQLTLELLVDLVRGFSALRQNAQYLIANLKVLQKYYRLDTI